VYRNNDSEQILLDYKEYEGKPGPPKPPHPDSIPRSVLEWIELDPVLKEINRVKANENYLKLITDAIQELLENRINNGESVTMSGVINNVISSDSTLVITDYQSTSWQSFQIIRNKIEKE